MAHFRDWFLDWFDGASRTLHGSDREIADMVWDNFSQNDLQHMIDEEGGSND